MIIITLLETVGKVLAVIVKQIDERCLPLHEKCIEQ